MPETTTIKFLTIDEVENAPDLQPIWGNWLFRDSVVLQAGEPGIAKTTFNFGLAKALVDNKSFLTVKPAIENPTVLYMEFEASKSLVKLRMRTMGGYPKNKERFILYLRDDEFHTMEQIYEAATHFEVKPDIIFADPIRLAFNMRDENDNAEGTRQMKTAKRIARSLNCCVVLVHHSSKAEMTGTRKGSGAGSRSALADVAMNFDRLCDSEGKELDRNLFALSIPKNRMIDDDFCICVRKEAEDKAFKVVEFPVGARLSSDGYGTAIERYTVQQLIVEEILGFHELKFSAIRDAVQRAGKEVTDVAIHKALSNLIGIGVAECSNETRNRLYWKVQKNLKKSEIKGKDSKP